MAQYAAQLITKVSTEGVEESSRQLGEMGKKVDESKSHFEGLKNALSMAAGFAIFGGMAGFGLIKDQIGSVIDLTKEYQLTQSQTNQVLKSTHDVSGMTAESLDKLAQAYGKTTMFSADTVQSGENLLLTFTNIGKQVFPQATQAILDVSQAMGQDLKSSAIQVGKALGDPVHGFAQLQRIGVTFSDEEKKAIKTMSAHNDIIGAQKVILHELSTEFGGSATAAGKTFGGQMEILKNQFDEIKIKIGGALLPVLSDLMNKYVVPLAGRFQDWMNKGGGLNDFKGWIQTASNFLQNQLIPALGQVLNQYVIPLGQSMYDLFVKTGFVQSVWSSLVGTAQTFLPLIGGLVTNITHFTEWMSKGSAPAQAVRTALIGIGGAILAIKAVQFGSDMVNSLSNISGAVKGVLSDGQKLLNLFSPGGIAAQTTASSAIMEGDLATVGGTADATAGDVSMIGSAAAGDAVEVTGAMGVVGGAFASIGGILAGAAGWLADIAGTLLSLPGPILGIIAGFMTVPVVTNSDAYKQWNKPQNWGTSQQQQQLNASRRPYAAHASGIFNNPVGHYATLAEQGGEWMHIPNPTVGYVPPGASVLPHGMSPSSVGGGAQNIQVDVYLDGARMTGKLMPEIVSAIRSSTGVRF